MSDIAVFYLARLAEGFSALEAFAKSYRTHPAGTDHTLVIIAKGFTRRAEFAVLASIFKGITYEVTTVGDDCGMDIHAYKIAAPRYPHPYCCFLNTYANIQSDGWLRKLSDAIRRPGVGLAGATASFESLNNSYEVLNGLAWMLNMPAKFNRHVTRSFAWIAQQYHPLTFRTLTSAPLRLRRFLGDIQKRRPTIESLLPAAPAIWANTKHLGKDFPYFPNPHIRTNGFIVRREDLIKTPLRGINPKFACCHFESGRNSLSARILRRGERLVMVGADGVAYEIQDWPLANCFRSGRQENLLIADNQTKNNDSMSDLERGVHSTLTWGGYLPDNPTSVLGVEFDGLRPLNEFTRGHLRATTRRPLISIVIPTRDRKELLLDAIKTVRAQGYENYEIVVFDNASCPPVKPSLDVLRDPRIKCDRSDLALPVTESWNQAISMATGDYVILIGDDDGLAPGYFERICEIVARFDEPDLIYSSLYQFFHPGVLRDRPLGNVQSMPMADFMKRRDFPFVLPKSTAEIAVSNSLRFRRSFMFNMPAFTISRRLLREFGAPIFRPSFPDYHFANFAFAKASRIVVEPRPIAFQGISTSSFGYTLFNQKANDGFKVLGHELDAAHHGLLPGDDYLSHYFVTMQRLASDIGATEPQVERYRRLSVYRQFAAFQSGGYHGQHFGRP